MRPRLDLPALRDVRAREIVLRFVFGGVVSSLALFVGHRYGVLAGGALLAFPAILPASLTLVKEHAGRKKAADDARGAILGAFGLVGFAAVVATLGDRVALPLALALGTLAWLAIAVAAFAIRYGRERE